MSLRSGVMWAAFFTALAMPAIAAERPLTGAEIDALIKGNTVAGHSDKGNWKQYFAASGETAYLSGDAPASYGAWDIRGDKFCSQWPPNDRWTCYDVTGDLAAAPKTITWIGGGGTKYPGAVQVGKQF